MVDFTHLPDAAPLVNALNEPVGEMILIEVDSHARAEAVLSYIETLPAPPALLRLPFLATDDPLALWEKARDWIASSDSSDRRIALFSAEDRVADQELDVTFWRRVNLLRERWESLSAQKLFLVFPTQYRHLNQVAIHFKNWFSLRIHLIAPLESPTPFAPDAFHTGLMSIEVAREVIGEAENRLREALSQGWSPPIIFERIYMPWVKAALSIRDINLAKDVFGRIQGDQIHDRARKEWNRLRFELAWLTRDWSSADEAADYLLTFSDPETGIAVSLYRGDRAAFEGDLTDALREYRLAESLSSMSGFQGARALAMGKTAGVLRRQGELDEALKLLREEVRPIFEGLDDARSVALTTGEIADILFQQGELDEALRIRRQEVLPVHERLGDVRERAIAMDKIADILVRKGDLNEALKIRREDVLPVEEQLGDVRGKAVTLSKIADILKLRGCLDEALEIWKSKVFPVFQQLGDIRECALTMGRIADVQMLRGELDEALQTQKRDVLPVYEQMGDIRERALAVSRIADILERKGELDEALRIREEEELPALERLGDVREGAITLGKIAGILTERGNFQEAIRIRKEEELPVYERLGEVRSLAVGRTNLAFALFRRNNEGDSEEALRLLLWSFRHAQRLGISEADLLAKILLSLGITQGQLDDLVQQNEVTIASLSVTPTPLAPHNDTPP